VQLADNKKRPQSKIKLWLRGHIYCAHCGGTMTPCGGGKRSERTLRCNRTAHYKEWGYEKCPNMPFKISEVEKQVWSKVIRFARDRPYMEERINNALGKLKRPDYETQLALHQGQVKKLKSKLTSILDQFGSSDLAALKEASVAHAEKVGKEIEVEEGMIAELEKTLALSRSKAELLKEVRAVLDQHTDQIENASYEDRCKIMDVLGVRVTLGYLHAIPIESLPEGLRERLDLPVDPNEPRYKMVFTEVFAAAAAAGSIVQQSRPSVKRKFFR
jgi:hypothetical protein